LILGASEAEKCANKKKMFFENGVKFINKDITQEMKQLIVYN